jgi:hypothetical protein
VTRWVVRPFVVSMGRLTLGSPSPGADVSGMTTVGTHRHTDGLWSALAAAVRDTDEDPTISRRRLAALRLHRSYAGAGDLD